MSGHRAYLGLWAAPLLLVAVTVFGLASALLGDAVWDVLSWIALAIPLGVCLWFALRRQKEERDGS